MVQRRATSTVSTWTTMSAAEIKKLRKDMAKNPGKYKVKKTEVKKVDVKVKMEKTGPTIEEAPADQITVTEEGKDVAPVADVEPTMAATIPPLLTTIAASDASGAFVTLIDAIDPRTKLTEPIKDTPSDTLALRDDAAPTLFITKRVTRKCPSTTIFISPEDNMASLKPTSTSSVTTKTAASSSTSASAPTRTPLSMFTNLSAKEMKKLRKDMAKHPGKYKAQMKREEELKATKSATKNEWKVNTSDDETDTVRIVCDTRKAGGAATDKPSIERDNAVPMINVDLSPDGRVSHEGPMVAIESTLDISTSSAASIINNDPVHDDSPSIITLEPISHLPASTVLSPETRKMDADPKIMVNRIDALASRFHHVTYNTYRKQIDPEAKPSLLVFDNDGLMKVFVIAKLKRDAKNREWLKVFWDDTGIVSDSKIPCQESVWKPDPSMEVIGKRVNAMAAESAAKEAAEEQAKHLAAKKAQVAEAMHASPVINHYAQTQIANTIAYIHGPPMSTPPTPVVEQVYPPSRKPGIPDQEYASIQESCYSQEVYDEGAALAEECRKAHEQRLELADEMKSPLGYAFPEVHLNKLSNDEIVELYQQDDDNPRDDEVDATHGTTNRRVSGTTTTKSDSDSDEPRVSRNTSGQHTPDTAPTSRRSSVPKPTDGFNMDAARQKHIAAKQVAEGLTDAPVLIVNHVSVEDGPGFGFFSGNAAKFQRIQAKDNAEEDLKNAWKQARKDALARSIAAEQAMGPWTIRTLNNFVDCRLRELTTPFIGEDQNDADYQTSAVFDFEVPVNDRPRVSASSYARVTMPKVAVPQMFERVKAYI